MKKAIKKINAVMEYIISLAEKHGVNISLDDKPHYIDDELQEGTGLYTASFGMGNVKTSKITWSSLEKINNFFDKQDNKPKNKLFSDMACEILNQLKEAKDIISIDETEKGIIILIDAMRKLPDFKISLIATGHRINGGKNTKGKISYNDSDVLKFYIDAYDEAAKDKDNPNPDCIGIHGAVTQDAMKIFPVCEKTLKSAFPHRRIMRELSSMKTLEKKK